MWKWETEGQAKAVIVIIHSAFEHHRWYAWLIEKFRTEGYHIVMGDLPGHGEQFKYTKVHDESVNEYLVYIKTLMQNALTYQLPVFIVGHGLGGTLALQFLKKSQLECAGVILTSPWIQIKKTTNLFTNAMTSLGNLTSNKKISLKFNIKMLTRNIEGFNEINDDITYHSNVTARWYKDIQALLKNIMTEQESTISIPILLMTSKQDQIAEPQSARKWLMNQKTMELQYKEWPYSYHNLFHDNEREEVFFYAKDFVNNVIRSIGYIVK